MSAALTGPQAADVLRRAADVLRRRHGSPHPADQAADDLTREADDLASCTLPVTEDYPPLVLARVYLREDEPQ